MRASTVNASGESPDGMLSRTYRLDVFHRRDRADTPFEGRRNVLHHCIPFRYCPASAGCIQETPVLPHPSSALARPVDGRDTEQPPVDIGDTCTALWTEPHALSPAIARMGLSSQGILCR